MGVYRKRPVAWNWLIVCSNLLWDLRNTLTDDMCSTEVKTEIAIFLQIVQIIVARILFSVNFALLFHLLVCKYVSNWKYSSILLFDTKLFDIKRNETLQKIIVYKLILNLHCVTYIKPSNWRKRGRKQKHLILLKEFLHKTCNKYLYCSC